MITPIAIHFGVPINEPPISLDICLDRSALKQRHMIQHDPNPRAWPWVLQQANGKFTFLLPNIELTNIMGENVVSRWRMNTPAHLALMTRIPSRNHQGIEILHEDEERREEEEEYEQSGDQHHQEAAQ